MVFSQTSQKTHSILKVVDINRLKREKNQQVNGLNGVISVVDQAAASCSHQSTTPTISMEEFLKTEPEEFQTMYHSDCEFFQDLGLWCSTPAKEEQPPIIDSNLSIEKTCNTNTLNTQSSGAARLAYDANSPTTPASFYNNVTPCGPLSPIDGLFLHDTKFCYPDLGSENMKANFQEQFLNITDLPVVIEASEIPIPSAIELDYLNTDYTKTYTLTQNRTPFIDQEDSLDMKLTTTVVPSEVEWNDVVISEYVINEGVGAGAAADDGARDGARRGAGLTLDVAARAPLCHADLNISTPDVLSFVEQLEKEKSATIGMQQPNVWTSLEDSPVASIQDSYTNSPAPNVEYEPITPKSESQLETDDDVKPTSSKKKRRRNSEDSDETYTPYTDVTPAKKTRRRKPGVPIEQMIQALAESQPAAKARRGRPPKRRDSAASSACSLDNGSTTTEYKYREIRDKNNEASKRSRMNRKLKELQMEQTALDLEERNKKLKVRADILEDMTKRMKNALMSAILKQ